MITIHLAHAAKDTLSPYNHGAREVWLHRLGPTAWCVLETLYDALDLANATELRPAYVSVPELAMHVGVKPSVLLRALNRLHRFQIAYWDPTYMVLMSDFRVPDRTEQSHKLRLESELS